MATPKSSRQWSSGPRCRAPVPNISSNNNNTDITISNDQYHIIIMPNVSVSVIKIIIIIQLSVPNHHQDREAAAEVTCHKFTKKQNKSLPLYIRFITSTFDIQSQDIDHF
jgi:hypothetical protein